MKTNKSFTKRLKTTKTGKTLAKKPGFNHFNAKQSRSKQLGGKKTVPFTLTSKVRAKMIPFK